MLSKPSTDTLRAQEHVIGQVWAQQPGRYACLSTKAQDGRWRDWFFDECDIDRFIERHKDENCYFAPMKFSRAQRLKQYAALPCLLWADLDAVDPHRIDLEPTVAIQSSPGRYAALWVTDRPVSEQLNKRMTYYCGADKGGWDLVQVLRLPGTTNYKYSSKPRARLLWDDGPTYRVGMLERHLPQVPTAKAVVAGDRKVSKRSMIEIIERHELDGWLKRELLGHGRPTGADGQRGYKVHWKMACELYDAGVGRDEAFVLLSETKWNKHTTEGPVWNMIDKIWEVRS